MQLFVNGEMNDVPVSTLAELIALLGHSGDSFAVAVDGDHVPKHSWSESKLAEHQSVEIIAPMQGG